MRDGTMATGEQAVESAGAFGADGVGDVTHGAVGIEAEARLALASLATQLVRPEGMLSTLDRERSADPSVEERLGLLTDRLRDATGELLSVLELTRSRMIGVELLQAHANQARVLLQLYDEHQQMVEELLRSQGTDGADALVRGPTDGLDEGEVAELLQLAAQFARLPSARLLGSTSSCECVICQAELRDVAGSLLPAGTGGDHEPCMLQCGHRFHRHCIGNWLQRSRKCPLCRAEQTPAKLFESVKPVKPREQPAPEAADTRRLTVSLTPPVPSARYGRDRPRTVSVSAWQSDSTTASSIFAGSSEAETTAAAALQNRPSTTQSSGRRAMRHSASRGTSRAVSRGSFREASRAQNGMRMGLREHLDLPPRPATSEASDAARLMRRRAESSGFGSVSSPSRDRTGSRGSLVRSASSPLTAPLAPLRSSVAVRSATGFSTNGNGPLSTRASSEPEPLMLRGHGDSHARARQQARDKARAAAQLSKRRRSGLGASPIRTLGSQSRRLATELPVRRRLSFHPR
eukprot:COSAG02_NODE_55_length_43887_cov_30.660364_20_plen_520_part_00